MVCFFGDVMPQLKRTNLEKDMFFMLKLNVFIENEVFWGLGPVGSQVWNQESKKEISPAKSKPKWSGFGVILEAFS